MAIISSKLPDDAMMTSEHSGKTGEKLSDVCKALLLGADALEEDEFASMSLAAETADAAVGMYRQELCFKEEGTPCWGIELEPSKES